MTAIADDDGVQSLGGVIGGEPTGCTEATTEVFVEAALFDPMRTAATGRRLEIISDARYRFERGVDPDSSAPGLEIATRLILELCGGEASRDRRRRRGAGMAAQLPAAPRARRRRWAGCDVPLDESRAHPRSAGLRGRRPQRRRPDGRRRRSWRGDIVGEADLVEEVLRVKGYDEIPAVPLAARDA